MGLNRSDLQRLAEMRLREAELLLTAQEHSGAYYLAGYAVECAIKARIASFTQQYDFPDKEKVRDSYTHSLKDLVKAANLVAELRKQQEEDPIFAAGWNVARNWNEGSRYLVFSQNEAEELIAAVNDEGHGVLRWLRLFW